MEINARLVFHVPKNAVPSMERGKHAIVRQHVPKSVSYLKPISPTNMLTRLIYDRFK